MTLPDCSLTRSRRRGRRSDPPAMRSRQPSAASPRPSASSRISHSACRRSSRAGSGRGAGDGSAPPRASSSRRIGAPNTCGNASSIWRARPFRRRGSSWWTPLPTRFTREVVASFAGVEYRRNERGIGSTATSRAIGISDVTEDVVAFIDDDAYAEPEWLEELLRSVRGRTASPRSAVAPATGSPMRRTRESGRSACCCPTAGSRDSSPPIPAANVTVDHLLGANMSVRMSAVQRSSAASGDFYPGTCLREETDIALRMRRAGMKIIYTPTRRRSPCRRRLRAGPPVRRPLPVLRSSQPRRAPRDHTRVPRSAPSAIPARSSLSARAAGMSLGLPLIGDPKRRGVLRRLAGSGAACDVRSSTSSVHRRHRRERSGHGAAAQVGP